MSDERAELLPGRRVSLEETRQFCLKTAREAEERRQAEYQREYEESPACEIDRLRTELASVTARLAAAEEAAIKVADAIEKCERQGEAIDSPEGARFITISHTMAVHLVAALRGFYYYKLDDAAIAAAVSAGWMQPLGERGGE